MSAVVESIENNVHAKWHAELRLKSPGPTYSQADMFPLLVRDLANAMARISVLERTVDDLRSRAEGCR